MQKSVDTCNKLKDELDHTPFHIFYECLITEYYCTSGTGDFSFCKARARDMKDINLVVSFSDKSTTRSLMALSLNKSQSCLTLNNRSVCSSFDFKKSTG